VGDVKQSTGRWKIRIRMGSSLGAGVGRSWLRGRLLKLLAPILERSGGERPFFGFLHELLDRHPHLTLGRLMDEAGEQVWGLTVLFLALLTFIPGVANALSLATLVVGLQMMWGAPHPWLPRILQNQVIHHGRTKELLAAIEQRLGWLLRKRTTRRKPSLAFTGFLVAWTAFLAALPLLLPFANALPALALILLGVALLEEWSLLAWIGAASSLAITIYFAFSIQQIIHWTLSLWRMVVH
jgi:hypothetical protein